MDCVMPHEIFYNTDYSLRKCCYNAVADCPPMKMKCYSMSKLWSGLRIIWVMKLIMRNWYWVMLILLGKGEKKKEVPVEQAKKKRKVEQKGKFLYRKLK